MSFAVKIAGAFFHFIIPALPITKGSVIVWTHVMLLTFSVVAETRFGADLEKNDESKQGKAGEEEGKEDEEYGITPQNDRIDSLPFHYSG